MSFVQSVNNDVQRTWQWCTSRETRRPRLFALLLILARRVLTFFTIQRAHGAPLYSSETLGDLPTWLRSAFEFQPAVEWLAVAWLVWILCGVALVRSQSLTLQHSISWS